MERNTLKLRRYKSLSYWNRKFHTYLYVQAAVKIYKINSKLKIFLLTIHVLENTLQFLCWQDSVQTTDWSCNQIAIVHVWCIVETHTNKMKHHWKLGTRKINKIATYRKNQKKKRNYTKKVQRLNCFCACGILIVCKWFSLLQMKISITHLVTQICRHQLMLNSGPGVCMNVCISVGVWVFISATECRTNSEPTLFFFLKFCNFIMFDKTLAEQYNFLVQF